MKLKKKTHPSGDGQRSQKTTVLGDRALGILRDAKRRLFMKLGSHPTVGRSVKMPRHKQPFWVRLYVSLVRVEFDACRVHDCVFDLEGLWILFKVLVDKKLSDQKRIIKDYSQLRLNLFLDERFESNPCLRKLERRFRVAAGLNHGRIVKRKSRKFRLLALELFQFKKITITTTKDENSTREESIAKHKAIVGGDPVTVRDEEKERFRRIVRDLLSKGGFSFMYEDSISTIPGGSSTELVKGKDGGCIEDISSYWQDLAMAPVIVEGTRGCVFAGGVTSLWRSSQGNPKICRVTSCSDTFKDRILTIHPSHQFCLKPLQERLLNFLKKLDCFFVGKDSIDDMVSRMSSIPGGYWCSGDYNQATDTFSSDLSEIVLEEVVRKIEFRLQLDDEDLEEFKRYIIESLTRWELDYDGELVSQQRGQLMGTLLSFPVLNIYNYAAFASLYEEYRRQLGYLGYVVTFEDIVDWVSINGDDIIFNEDKEFVDFWIDGVRRYGMSLNKAKTGISCEFGSLNSQYFRFSENGASKRYKSEMVYILNKEGGFERAEKTFKKNTLKERAQALFNGKCWKSLNYFYKLNDCRRYELRKFFGPLTEEDAEKEERGIFKSLNENANFLSGKELFRSGWEHLPSLVDKIITNDYGYSEADKYLRDDWFEEEEDVLKSHLEMRDYLDLNY